MKTIDFPDGCDIMLDKHQDAKKGKGCVQRPGELKLYFSQAGCLCHDLDDAFQKPLPRGRFKRGEEYLADVKNASGDVNFIFVDDTCTAYTYVLTIGPKDCDESSKSQEDHSDVVASALSVACWSIFAGVAAALIYKFSSQSEAK